MDSFQFGGVSVHLHFLTGRALLLVLLGKCINGIAGSFDVLLPLDQERIIFILF